MPNANARKGQRWESAVRDYLNSAGMNNATRVAQAGTDVGDIHLNGLFAIQCKDVAAAAYPAWVRAAEEQADAGNMRWGVVAHKKRNRPVGEAHVVMSLDTFEEIATQLAVLTSIARGGSSTNG